MGRRIGWLLLAATLLTVFAPRAETAPVAGGETLVYDIALLWFDRMAEGHISFTAGERPGTFRAELAARTLGVAATLTGDREQRYVSLMARGADGRLRSLSHEAIIFRGRGEAREQRGKRYLFDHAKGEVRYQRLKAGAVSRDQILPLDPRSPPDDILTAFFNLRNGVLGPLEPGARYTIPAFSHKGPSTIVVEILRGEEREAQSFFPRGGLLARVTVDQEVFDTGGGYVYVWFDENRWPARGIVDNVSGVGSVRGILRER